MPNIEGISVKPNTEPTLEELAKNPEKAKSNPIVQVNIARNAKAYILAEAIGDLALRGETGITFQTLEKMIQGNRHIKKEGIKKLATFLGIAEHELMFGDYWQKNQDMSYSNIGPNILKRCQEKGINLLELEALSGVPYKTIIRTIDEKGVIWKKSLRKLAEALRVSVYSLLKPPKQ